MKRLKIYSDIIGLKVTTITLSRSTNPAEKWILAASLALSPLTSAYAQSSTTNDPTTYLKNLAEYVTGPLGQSLAILGIIAIGLAWMFGRASLGLVAGVVGGIVILFGATTLVSKLLGTGSGASGQI